MVLSSADAQIERMRFNTDRIASSTIPIVRHRRQLLAALALVSVTAVSGRVRAQSRGTAPSPMPGMAPGTMTAQVCIESCWRCHVTCVDTERYCLEKGGMHAVVTHVALMADCADMCIRAADSMIRHSSAHAAICTACAQLCESCAQECEAFKNDKQMLVCARTCRDCAAHCREMSKLAI